MEPNHFETVMGSTIPNLVSAVENLAYQVNRLADTETEKSASKEEPQNELAIFLGNAGWIYVKTCAETYEEAESELEKRGIDICNLNMGVVNIELRDSDGRRLD